MNEYFDWARATLLHESETGFKRGRELTWFNSRLPILVFMQFSAAERMRLASILPTGAAFSGVYDSIRRELGSNEQKLVEQFRSLLGKGLDTSISPEAQEWFLFCSSNRKTKLGKDIASTLVRLCKQECKKRGFKLATVEPLVFWASKTFASIEYVVEFDALQSFVLTYSLAKMGPVVLSSGETARIPKKRSSYLQMLGLGASGWECRQVESAKDVAERAVAFTEWHVHELARITDADRGPAPAER